MPFLRKIEIKDLFGLYDHEINFRDAPVTLVAGPNGVGKTTLLALTHALLTGSYSALARQQFSQLSVVSTNGSRLTAAPVLGPRDDDALTSGIQLTFEPRPGTAVKALVDVPLVDPSLEELPPWLRQVGPGVWEDERDGEILSEPEVMNRYLVPRHPRQQRYRAAPSYPDWFVPADWSTDFIETKRLDSLLMRSRVTAHGRSDHGRAPIHVYLEAVSDSMRQARFESSRIAQQRDRTFARRLLDKASRLTVHEPALRARYNLIEDHARDLALNGLLADSLDVLPVGGLNPTEKRILNLFLDDFDAKMAPLQPVSDRLNQLRSTVDSKFLNKRVVMDAERGPVFVSDTDTDTDPVQIDADALSSGEQHELALISRLLFSVRGGTTVLIDEPELSLHVTWQHRMLNDLAAIGEIVGIRFLLATHSTAIINGRWDLVEELGPIDDSLEGSH